MVFCVVLLMINYVGEECCSTPHHVHQKAGPYYASHVATSLAAGSLLHTYT